MNHKASSPLRNRPVPRPPASHNPRYFGRSPIQTGRVEPGYYLLRLRLQYADRAARRLARIP